MTQFSEQVAYYNTAPVVLVIGCGDMGIGSARVLGQRAPLLIVDINEEALQKTVETLRHEGYQVSGQVCDISDEQSVARLAETVAAGPGVRVLAHVAAVGNTPKGWRHVMSVDLLGPHLIARAIGPHMVPGGVAIWISSTGCYRCPVDDKVHALIDDPFQPDFEDKVVAYCGTEPDFLTAYFMAKQGLNRMSQRLALEWGPRQVRSVSLSPGLINSTMGRTGGKSLPVYDGSGEERLGTRAEKAAREVPLQRQGTVLEIIDAVAFLASDAASFINGIDLPVDGGSTARWRSIGEIAR